MPLGKKYGEKNGCSSQTLFIIVPRIGGDHDFNDEYDAG